MSKFNCFLHFPTITPRSIYTTVEVEATVLKAEATNIGLGAETGASLQPLNPLVQIKGTILETEVTKTGFKAQASPKTSNSNSSD